jgi:hypothetical protein
LNILGHYRYEHGRLWIELTDTKQEIKTKCTKEINEPAENSASQAEEKSRPANSPKYFNLSEEKKSHNIKPLMTPQTLRIPLISRCQQSQNWILINI